MKEYRAEFEKQDDVLIVKLGGQLDTNTAPMLEAELNPHLEDARKVVMDFGGVEYISSAGIRLLLATEQYLEGRGAGMKLIQVNDHVHKIFDMVGFTNIMPIERI